MNTDHPYSVPLCSPLSSTRSHYHHRQTTTRYADVHPSPLLYRDDDIHWEDAWDMSLSPDPSEFDNMLDSLSILDHHGSTSLLHLSDIVHEEFCDRRSPRPAPHPSSLSSLHPVHTHSIPPFAGPSAIDDNASLFDAPWLQMHSPPSGSIPMGSPAQLPTPTYSPAPVLNEVYSLALALLTTSNNDTVPMPFDDPDTLASPLSFFTDEPVQTVSPSLLTAPEGIPSPPFTPVPGPSPADEPIEAAPPSLLRAPMELPLLPSTLTPNPSRSPASRRKSSRSPASKTKTSKRASKARSSAQDARSSTQSSASVQDLSPLIVGVANLPADDPSHACGYSPPPTPTSLPTPSSSNVELRKYTRASKRTQSRSSSAPYPSRSLPSTSSSSPASASGDLPSPILPINNRKLIHTRARHAVAEGPILPPAQGSKTCGSCSRTFGRSDDYKRHMISHIVDPPKWCCGGLPLEKALQAGVKIDHEKVYDFEGVAYYGGCMKAFRRRDAFVRHVKAGMAELTDTVVKPQVRRASKKKQNVRNGPCAAEVLLPYNAAASDLWASL